MSRIGNKPIAIPEGIEVHREGKNVIVKGPKGTIEKKIHDKMDAKLENNCIIISRPDDEKESKSLHGLTRSLINNMNQGVSKEFTKELEVNGVGYRAAKQGKTLVLTLGYSHLVKIEEPEGITFEVPNPNSIIVKGVDKELVGQVAANVRAKRLPEVYGGKGIKYIDEHIRRKVGKTGK